MTGKTIFPTFDLISQDAINGKDVSREKSEPPTPIQGTTTPVIIKQDAIIPLFN